MDTNKIILHYKNNDKLNIEQIVTEYTPYLFKIARNISNGLLTQEDIEELLSDTFFTVWINKDKLQEDKLLSPYLVGILKNLILKKYRNIKFASNFEDYDNTFIYNNDVILTLEQKELNVFLYKEINKLSEKDKKIFELFYYSNKHSKEIAKIINTKDLIVRSRLHRIRKRLCKSLEGNDYGKKL